MALTISLDWDEILRIAVVGTTRTAAFLALGLHTADQPPPSSLALGGSSNIRLLPDPLPPELARHIVSEWRAWVVGAALRELDGTYALFLERAFAALLLVESYDAEFGAERQKALKAFTAKTNTRDRLVTLLSRIGHTSDVACHMQQVSRARNILTHNAGIVRASDCGDDAAFGLTWIGLDMVITDIGGHSEFLRYRGDAPLPIATMPDDGIVGVALVERERRFAVGESVAPAPHDLHEICLMYRREADRVIGAIRAQASARGVPIRPTPTSDAQNA